jgi:hypothetical protein
MSTWPPAARVAWWAERIALASAGSTTPHSGPRSGSLPSVVTGTAGEVTASTTS